MYDLCKSHNKITIAFAFLRKQENKFITPKILI